MSTAAVVPVAVAAAILAGAAPTSPTDIAWLDDVLCGVIAGTMTMAAVHSSAVALAIAGVLVAIGAAEGPSIVALPAGAATGLAVGLAATNRGPAELRALPAAVLAVCAFHLAWPEPVGATTGLGAAAVIVVVVSGVLHLPPRRRRVVVVGIGAVSALAVVATALGLLAVMRARPDLAAGAERAEAGLEAARRGNVVEGARALEAAQASFTRARRDLRAWWARPARAVPVVAHQTRAVDGLAAVGADIAGAGARLAAVSDPATFRISGGTVPIDRIRALVGPAEQAEDVLDRGAGELQERGKPWLAPTIRREVDRLLPRVERAGRDAGIVARAAGVAPALLGGDGPRRWFLALQSAAELRATGGFIGSFGEIAADGGALRLERIGRIAELNKGGAREIDGPPEYLARYARFDPHLLWQNVNMSPDFPTVAGVIAGLYPQSGGKPVDGVIAVDPYGLADLLRVVGPVRVADWPEPITAGNAVPVLLHEQYVRFPQTAERVDFLGHVTEAVWRRLLDGTVGIVDLGRALVDAIDEKHVMLASTRAEEQRVLSALEVTGAVAPVEDDFLAVVTQNATGNKIDWFLRRAVDYRVAVDERTGRVRATARITLRNEAPAGGLPPYVLGTALKPPIPNGTNRTYLSVYTPWLVERAAVDGKEVGLESARELGRRVYSTFLDIPPGGSVVVELDLGATRVGRGRYDVVVHRQPAVAADEVSVAAGGRVQRISLRRDRTLSFTL